VCRILSVPKGRRFGHVNVICVMVLHVLGGRRGKTGCGRGWVKDLKWASDSEHGPARMEVCDYLQRVAIPSERVVLYKILRAPHAMCNNTCLFIV
jgi:hypothetical protein